MAADPGTHVETLSESAAASIGRIVTGPLDNNVYFLTCKKTGKTAMFDAPGSKPLLLGDICRSKQVDHVFVTHGHWDHIGAVGALRAQGLRVHIGDGDAECVEHDAVIRDDETFDVGDITVCAKHTPGHTQGSTCFLVSSEHIVFSGDTLFPGGPGATNKPGSDFETIMSSLTQLFDLLDDHTLVLPGHGGSTTIGNERPHLDEWRARGW